jgi:hypothetical protein
MNEFCFFFLLRGRRRHKCLCSFEQQQQQQWTERETFRGVGGVDYTTERRKSERILFFVVVV